MNITTDLKRFIRKNGNKIYKIHILTGLLSLLGLVVLCLTGVVLLCRGPIAQWNNMGVQPPAAKTYTSEELWSHLTAGLGEMDRHFPGSKVIEVSTDTRRGLLKFLLAPEKKKDEGNKSKAAGKENKGKIYTYDVELKTVNSQTAPVYRSELVRSFTRFAHGLHTAAMLNNWTTPVFFVFMLLAALAVLSGFLFHWVSCTAPLGRITVPQKSSWQFWSDTHRLTGAVAGAYVLVMAFTGVLLPGVTDSFTKDLKEHEVMASEYFLKIDTDYGKVASNEVLLPSEALRRLRENFPVDEYRLLSMKLPTRENEFFSFYLADSPFGSPKYNAIELVGMRPDGENIFVVSPSPAARLMARIAQLHRTWTMNPLVSLMWGIYLLISIWMLISGIYIHVRRHQGRRQVILSDKKPDITDKFLLPIIFSLAVFCSFISALIDSSGLMAVLMLLIPIILAGYIMRTEN